MCFLLNGNHPYQLLWQMSSAAVEECGLVSAIYEWEGLISAGFKVGRTGFGWLWLIPDGFRYFRVVSGSSAF